MMMEKNALVRSLATVAWVQPTRGGSIEGFN